MKKIKNKKQFPFSNMAPPVSLIQ